jgi:glycosyltransferase involved in cell wall biosynthesis
VKKIGIYNPYLDTRGGGERITLALAEVLSKQPNTQVSLISHKKADLDAHGHYFQIDLSKVDNFVVDVDTPFLRLVSRLPLPGRVRNLMHDIRVGRAVKKAGYDVFVNNCYQSNMPNPSKVGVYMCMFPQKLSHKRSGLSPIKLLYIKIMDGLYRLFLYPGSPNAIATYQLITANSKYTQSYITKRWKRDSDIVYPYGEDMLKPSQAKKNIIMSVGRFFADAGENHNKRHDFMVKTFTELTDLHKKGWELHLVGSVAEDVDTLKYILEMIKAANGHPVYFHFNASFAELKDLYNQATMYWHATGYGTDPEKHPEKQEHFGITTVESMSAKCIPVVINSAGQRESVAHDAHGFLWSTPKELRDETIKVANMSSSTLKQFQDAARKGYQTYDKKAFEETVITVFGPIIS